MKTQEEIRDDFPILKNITYLDSASTSITPKPVIDAIDDYYYNYNANSGRGAYRIAIKASNKLEDTRSKIANLINADKNEIIFTKNTTEAINMIANGFKFEKNDNIIISNVEHHSNFVPWLNLEKNSPKNIKIKIANANSEGIVENSTIEELLDENTKLVAISHVTNSIGACQDIKRISKTAHRNNSYFLLDCAQSIGHVKIDNKKINADFIASPGHKGLLGPMGTGFLYGKKEILEHVEPTNLGGGTITNLVNKEFTLEEVPYRFEGGTQNIDGIIGLGAGIDYINQIGLSNIYTHSKYLTQELYKGLSEIKNVILYGNPKNIFSIISFNIKGANPYDVAKILDETANICVRSGFHCAIPSLKHMKAKEGTIRVSFHYYNNLEDIIGLLKSVEEIANFYK
ncbi:cysteine desulfurase SufS [Methanobrevibacter cuticularis]|uniref:cysteine desulfurase n=1 Tax=Methanobrevibacter cuticularis TaxID=47311 RepID=A0A166DXC2_9EURY|nr:cysteine desulfurase [Methanobrevibacter cuticularis]KZX16051.1 cysteine desulfurase SufS [Methanobrevibacter cuticularis]